MSGMSWAGFPVWRALPTSVSATDSLRAWLNPDKLAALNMSAMDVVTAISQQNIQVAAGSIGQRPVPKGQQFQETITTQGRLVEPDQFEMIILKSVADSLPSSGSMVGASSGGSGSTGSDSTGASAGAAANTSSSTTDTSTATGIVRLRDVATVVQGAQQYDQSCAWMGHPPLR